MKIMSMKLIEDDDQKKWFIFYNCDMKKIDIIYNTVLKTHCIYFSSKEIAKQAIDCIWRGTLKEILFWN